MIVSGSLCNLVSINRYDSLILSAVIMLKDSHHGFCVYSGFWLAMPISTYSITLLPNTYLIKLLKA